MSLSRNPVFQDAETARQWLEGLLWPDGPVCPHCGVVACCYKLEGKSHRAGLYKCKACEEQFTVTVGTLFERSHIPLNIWLLAFHLMVASKKGISAHQLHRMLGLTYKSAWFMCHRIRAALMPDTMPPLGGLNKVVEADESYVGRRIEPEGIIFGPDECKIIFIKIENVIKLQRDLEREINSWLRASRGKSKRQYQPKDHPRRNDAILRTRR